MPPTSPETFYPTSTADLLLSLPAPTTEAVPTVPKLPVFPSHPRAAPSRVSYALPTLHTVLTTVNPFLTDADRSQLLLASSSLVPNWGILPLFPLWSFTHHRKRIGFGPDRLNVGTSHAAPDGTPLAATAPHVVSPELLGHYAWDFLSPQDQQNLVASSPSFHFYHRLRVAAAHGTSLAVCRMPPCEDKSQPLPFRKAFLLAVALCRANFVYADMYRWLGGSYNNHHRRLADTFDIIDRVKAFEPPPDYPRLDYARTWQLFHLGAPLAGHYSCSRVAVSHRNLLDNYPGVQENLEEITKKFKKEEQLQYHLFLPRIIWRFLPGLFLSLINWVAPKPHRIGDTGRLCIDPSSKITATDDGNTNAQIPDAGRDDDCNPAVAYGTAFLRFLRYIYNLRIDHPSEDILLSADDISAAFRRVTYNPNAALAFASVLGWFLIIPVGMIFGAKNSPSYYMLPGELRAHLSRYLAELTPARTLLADTIAIPPPPSPRTLRTLTPATPDALNQGTSHLLASQPSSFPRPVYAPFVDDTGGAAIRSEIHRLVNSSILAAYVTFGFPDEDPHRPDPINPIKFVRDISHSLKFLGYIINTRTMTISWPSHKQTQLQVYLQHALDLPTTHSDGRRLSPQMAATILGLVRHSAPVSLLGIYYTLSLQYALNDRLRATAAAGKSTRAASFWHKTRFTLNRETVMDLRTLLATLHSSRTHIWTRPIALCIPRVSQFEILGDASIEGLGGWLSTHYPFMWRLTKPDLLRLGFILPKDMQSTKLSDPTQDTPDALWHINLLEFVVLLINFWFLQRLASHATPQPQTLVISMRTDNTSALSWLSHAARAKRPATRRLARLFQAMLTSAPIPVQLQASHIAGELNHNADLLSRPSLAPTWASVIEQSKPVLDPSTAYRVPSKLLSMILTSFKFNRTEDELGTRMIELWTLEALTFPDGPLAITSPPNFYLA